MLIFNIRRRGLMPNLIKKSWTVSTLEAIGLNGVHAQITQNDHICQPLQSLSCQILLNHRASTDQGRRNVKNSGGRKLMLWANLPLLVRIGLGN